MSTNDYSSFEIFRLEIETDYSQHHYQIKTDTEIDILTATKNDPTIQKHYAIIQQGWPEKIQHLTKELRHFWNFRDELTINNGFIYKGHCTYVPDSLKNNILQKIHSTHIGATSNIRMANEVLFWPGMSKDIKDMCNACEECAKYLKNQHRKNR